MTKEKISILSTLTNLGLGASKVAIGIFLNSKAILANGLHLGVDFISSFGVQLAFFQ